MDKKYIKDFGLLLGLVIIVSIIARFMARGETLEEACMVHGVDAEQLAKTINEHING